MNNIRIIYRILKALESSMDTEEFDERIISAETLHISPHRRLLILFMLLEAKLIEGIRFSVERGQTHIYYGRYPRLTLKGLEYLTINPLMRYARRMDKQRKDSH